MHTSIHSISKSKSIVNWLHDFLSARGFGVSQNKPLYQYHLTTREYHSLRTTLTNSQRFYSNNGYSTEWCAAFTLYGAEWFRREYSGDWSWQPIFKSLDFELTASQISNVVPKGLVRFWHRPLSKFGASNSNDYIGSMFREGGLPSNLLSSESSHYKNAFFSVFERYQDAKDVGVNEIDRLIRSRIVGLPQTLQSDDSVELIANMVDKLDRLVYQFSLHTQNEPAKYLDAQYPRWRESFPLPLESETGSAFLSQLLFTASKEVGKVARKHKTLACTHFISFANQSLYTEITLPDVCYFELTKEQLKTSRIELAIFEGDEQIASLGTGFVQFEQHKISVPMRNSSAQVYRSHSGSELYLAAMQAGCKLAEIRLSSSAIDIGEAPLSLVECDDKWQMLSQSSLKTKHAQVGVLCPTDATITLVYGELSDSELSFAGLAFKLLNGQCELTLSQHERYIITTSADDFESDSYVLHGEQLQWKTAPSLVFKGVPSVRRESQLADSEYRENVSIYLGKSAIGLLSPSELYGRQLVVAKTADGIIQLRKRVGILPKDFDIELVNGDAPNQGVIRVKTASPCAWNVISDRVEVINSTKRFGEKEIWVRAIGNPPATVAIAVRANILSEPIVIDVPFPARGAMAYHHDGKPLAKRLTVSDLLGSRLHLFSTQGIPANFKVEAVVRKLGHGNSKQPFYRWDYRVTDKTVEVNLYGLKDAILELLSLSEMLDGEVELSITGPGKPLTFTINHYSTILEHDRINNTLGLRSTASLNANDVKPVLMSLSDPVQKPYVLVAIKSEGVNTGEYELPTFIEQDGPWLVIPQRSSEVSFRAKYFAGCNKSLNGEEAKTLQKATQLYHPQSNPDVIANVLKEMSLDWSHSGWAYLKDTYKNFGYLPLSTFEVWRHLVRDEKALAVAVFHFENDAKFISRVESELPIVWEMIAIKYWQHAADLMRNALHGLGIPDDFLKPMIKDAIEKLGRAVPAFAETLVNWLVEDRTPAAMPVDLVKGMSELWYQDLLRTHSEDNQWPTEYGEEIKQCCINLRLLPFNININMNYQSGVVYLPLFVAAVALGFVPEAISKQLPKDAIFHLRKLRDFDRDWFEPMYRCFIAYFANQYK